jgi:hypothetical protein
MDSPATQVAAAIEQVLPSANIAEAPTSAMGLIAQTPAAVISENVDTSSLVAAAAEAQRA